MIHFLHSAADDGARVRVCGTMVAMNLGDESKAEDYEGLHATVVDAIRYVSSGQPPEEAAHEVLQRLRDAGLAIPHPGSSAG